MLCALIALPVMAGDEPQCILEEFRSGDKLSYSRASDIAQDDRGFIWMGMWNGLCRYDGQAFQLFRAEPNNNNPLSNNRIQQIEIDSRQNIWCTTFDSRLYLFDRETLQFRDIFADIDSLCFIPKTRRALYSLPRKGVTWAVLSDGSCLRFNDANPTEYDLVAAQGHVGNNLPGAILPGVFMVTDDSFGHEWILADWGVQIYGGPQLTGRPYFRLHEINHRIFLASGDGSLVEYSDAYGMQEISLPVPVRNIYMTTVRHDNRLVLATDLGLLLYDADRNTFQQVQQTREGAALPEVYEFYNDARNRLWLFTNTADFYRLDPDGTVRRFPAPDESLQSTERYHLHLMFEDADGRIWGKARRGGLTWFDEATETLQPYTLALGTPEDRIPNYNVFFIDRQRTLWLSATPSLFHLSFQRRQFRYIQNPQRGEVRSMLADDERHGLWMGDRNGYLALRTADGRWRYLTQEGRLTDEPKKLVNSGIYALLRDSRGDLWVGTRGDGLFRMRATGLTTCTIRQFRHDEHNTFSLSEDRVYALYEDVNDHLWVGTYGGGVNLVEVTEEDSVHFFHHANRMPGYPISDFGQVRCIAGTPRGELMVGTTGGLLTFTSDFSHPATVTFHQHMKRNNDPTGLPGNDIMRVVHTDDGRNYVCTFGLGISEILEDNILSDTLHYQSHLNHEYPAGDVIVSGMEDHSGRIWLVADGSVSKFETETGNFTYFDHTDFDRDYRFTEAAPTLDSAGVMTLGLMDGMLSFHCDSLHKSAFSPRIVFTGYRYPGDQDPTLCNDMERITLRSGQRSVSIAFAALDYHPSQLLRYAYRMERIDTAWTYSNTPMVNYVNLPSGTYRLHVRSTNHDGQWCANERILTIRVYPGLWKEPWFWTVVCLLLVGGLVSVVYFRYYRGNRRVRKHRQRLRADGFGFNGSTADDEEREEPNDLPPLI
jgi:ligand-binding sensor domain-containing protein